MKKGLGAPKCEQKGVSVSCARPSQKGSKTLAKELALLAHQKVSVGARHMQSRHVYWVLKVLTFLTPFCKTFLLTNTDFLTSLQYEGCNEALKRIAPRFKMEEIKKLIDGIPYTTELQREFYKQILMLRKEKIIDYSLSKLQEQERKKQRPNMDFKAKKRTKNPLER